MPSPRISEKDLQAILNRKGYGLGGGIQSQIGPSTITSKISGAGEIDDLESDTLSQSLGSKKLQINYSGKPEIRITFYRHRLADHSRAISEKALVDGLQYAGIIEGDSQEEIRLTYVEQEKIGADEKERTEIDIIYPEVDLDNLWVPAKKHAGR
jgi:hypothetical protein